MIILIDDKKKRQEDFGWTDHKFNQYENIIQLIYSLENLKTWSKDIFQKGNIVLYHESFLDNTTIKKEAAIKRSQLEEYAKENFDFNLAIFSGSKSSRSLSGNIAHLPVSIVFQNLEVLSHKALQGDNNLKYLLFGENPEIEEKLSLMLDIANKEIDSDPAKTGKTKNLFLRPTKGDIQNAIENAEVEILYNDVSDEKLSEKVKDWLTYKEFDNLFIPICFGPVLSDFNGLRLATHIRCTKSPNQIKNIFIYSFVGIEYLFDNEYFNILKTKNVFLVDYKKSAFAEAIKRDLQPLTINDLPKELKKIKIEPPKNYEDSHSIANEWAIYQWAIAINTSDNDIEKIIKKINNQLYFKYLSSIYPKEEINTIPEEKLKIKYSGNPKILYIDDEANKGWYEILCKVLFDINNIDFQYLDEEFNSKNQDEIIKISIDKISKDDIDLVLLDFRLYPNDFITNDIQEVTGLKLLNEIKKLNPGIKVIIFSATNKIWNFQALQNAGADGFVLKESPELWVEKNFTKTTVEKFALLIQEQLKYQFQKELFKKCKDIKRNLLQQKFEENEDYKKLIKDLIKQIDIIYSSISLINLKKQITLDIVFLTCYNFLELFKNYYLIYKKDYRYYLGFEDIDLIRYSVSGGTVESNGPFIANGKFDSPSWFALQAALFIDYFKVSVSPYFSDVVNLKRISDKRNDYIHSTKKSFDPAEIKLIIEALNNACKQIKE
jgi:CheY-like chemotaxis protein